MSHFPPQDIEYQHKHYSFPVFKIPNACFSRFPNIFFFSFLCDLTLRQVRGENSLPLHTQKCPALETILDRRSEYIQVVNKRFYTSEAELSLLDTLNLTEFAGLKKNSTTALQLGLFSSCQLYQNYLKCTDLTLI